jgi:6-pyruvoyl-tetrahydropterin synthase
MVIDFTDLKKIVKRDCDQFDHATVFNETTHVELAHELRTEVIMLFW